MIDREHLELHPEDERIPQHPPFVSKRRGCLLLVVAIIAIFAASPIGAQVCAVTACGQQAVNDRTQAAGIPDGGDRLERLAERIPSTVITLPAVPHGASEPIASMPAPTTEIGTALVGGVATWYDAPGLQAAVPWWQAGQQPVLVRVCASRCIVVKATGFCACGDRDGRPTIADLSRQAFARLAPLSVGVVEATMEWPLLGLPATDQ